MSPIPDMRRVRAVVFDLDGTLIDSYDAIAESLNHALAALDFPPVPIDVVRSLVGRGLESLIDRAMRRGGPAEGPDTATIDEAVRLFRKRYDAICVDRTSLLPGVKPTLDALKERGYRLSVATNKPSYFAVRLLDALGVGRCLDTVMGPDLVSRPKPDPEMVITALARMGVAAGEALYVGDMPIDVETARAAGLPVIVMPTGSSGREELASSGADLVLDDVSGLLDLLPGPCYD